MTTLSREEQLLISLCRVPLTSSARLSAERLLKAPVHWPELLEFAAEWEMEPVAFTNLLSLRTEAIPGAVVEELIARNRAERARWLLMTRILIDLLRTLDEAGIAVIVLKGPAISLTAYGDASLRPFRDFDLLVHREDLEPARDVLLGKGYVAEYDRRIEAWLTNEQLPLELTDGRTNVDLHWAPFSRNWRLDFNLEEIWAEARTIACLDSSITVLSPEHLFVFLCGHGAKHRWSTFRWICDLAQLEDRLTAAQIDRVLTVAAAARARRILSLGLAVVRDVFGKEGSMFSAVALSPDDETRKLVAQVRGGWTNSSVNSRDSVVSKLDPTLSLLVFWAATRERMWDRIASISRFVLHPSARDARARPLHWVWRPFRLAVTAVRHMTPHRSSSKSF